MTAGQVLARLDRTQLDALLAENDAAIRRADAAIEQSKSLIAQAQAQVDWTTGDYARAQKLGGGVMSASTIEQRETAHEDRAGAVRRGQQRARASPRPTARAATPSGRNCNVRISRTDVKAPVSGVVSRRSAKLGATVSSAGEPLFRIIVDGAIDLEAEAPEQSLARFANGMPATLRLPGVADPVQGHVRLISEEVDKASRTGKVRIALSDVSHAHIGAFASGEVELVRRDGDRRAGRVPAARRRRRPPLCRARRPGRGAGRHARHRRRRRRSRSRTGSSRERRRRARRRLPPAGRPRARNARNDRFRRLGDPMRFNVSAWSIRRPIPAVVAFAVLTILGLVSFRTMPITRFPNIDIPIVQVLITQSGAAPAELESQVTKKVEDAVASLNGVWHIISTVTDGSSSTIVQFNVGSVDIDRALNDVKDQIAKIRGDLPRTIDEPIVSRVDIEGLPIVTYAASAPGHVGRASCRGSSTIRSRATCRASTASAK